MRKLPAAAQEERRRQVVGLRQRGLTYRAIAEQVGLSRTGVINIYQRFAAAGAKGLVSKPRGRKPDEQRLLDAAQEAEIQGLTGLAPPRWTSTKLSREVSLDAQDPSRLCTGVPAPDGRAGPRRRRPGRLVPRVRTLGPGHPELGRAG